MPSPRFRRAASAEEAVSLARRGRERYAAIEDKVKAIIDDVAKRGDKALYDYLERFHGVRGLPVRLSEEEVTRYANLVDESVAAALKDAARSAESVARAMLPSEVTVETWPGVRVIVAYRPIERLGVYVPRGGASYPSTAVMVLAAAKAAGVRSVAVASPPGSDGSLDPAIVYAATIFDVREFYRLGGAYAAAALALGTESVPKVDMIAGPGGAWFTAAKKLLYGVTGIDMIAGPTELVVVADGSIEPELVAWDLAAQAEHSSDTLIGLVALEEDYISAVEAKLEEIASNLPTGSIIRESISRSGFAYVARSVEEALQLSNDIAPEHLYIAIDDADLEYVLRLVRNVGAVTVGRWAAPALSDYTAGSNHVLPTDGWARFRGGLSVLDFLKPVYLVEATREGFAKSCGSAVNLAEYEGLPGHAGSLKVRRC